MIDTNDTVDMTEYKFGPVKVSSCCSADVSIQIRDNFLPEHLIIPGEIAGDFLITDFKVGDNSQFISTGCLPAMVFSSGAIPECISGFDCAKAGKTMTISITNQSKEERTFTAIIKSPMLKKNNSEFKHSLLSHKKLFLGFGSTSVAALGFAIINVQPQYDFLPERLIIPSTIIDNFQVLSLLVRAQNQLIAEEYMDSCLLHQSFAETSRGKVFFKQIASRGMFLAINVKNVTDNSVNFQAAVVGYIS